jgi:Pyruvate/2-oxoacid:ferredoxin oxidoreductase delta subunit
MSPYQKLIIYYFSGTGNSKTVAMWISHLASERHIEPIVLNITSIDRLSIEKPPFDALLIFVSPVHGFNYPPVMLNFIARFSKGQNHVLLMNTRAGMLIGKHITPGLTGAAFFVSAILLKLKGYTIKGMIPVDLPSNWISIHPGLNDRTIQYLHKKNKERVARQVGKVISGNNNFRALREIIQDVVISPISLGYYCIGRFVFAKTFYASNDCNNCDLCLKNCPVKAIIKVNQRPYWTFKCESCMNCMSHCPKKAIQTAHGPFLIYSLIYSFVLLVLFYTYLPILFLPSENKFICFLLEQVIFLVFFNLWYTLMHYLLRFRWVERIIVYSSLTSHKFWRKRYKALKYK